MNEKWCSDTLDKLLNEVKKDSAESFEDIPTDSRRMRKREEKSRKGKKTLGLKDFPKEWLRPSAQ